MTALVSAENVAKFMISYSYSKNKPISNLQLQKFLYFCWIEYYKKSDGERLFDDAFYAWKFGPVIPDIYYQYCANGGLPITERYDVKLGKAEGAVKQFVDLHSSQNPFILVSKSHEPDHAWDLVFNSDGNGSGNRQIIPFDLIIDKECIQ